MSDLTYVMTRALPLPPLGSSQQGAEIFSVGSQPPQSPQALASWRICRGTVICRRDWRRFDCDDDGGAAGLAKACETGCTPRLASLC